MQHKMNKMNANIYKYKNSCYSSIGWTVSVNCLQEKTKNSIQANTGNH